MDKLSFDYIFISKEVYFLIYSLFFVKILECMPRIFVSENDILILKNLCTTTCKQQAIKYKKLYDAK